MKPSTSIRRTENQELAVLSRFHAQSLPWAESAMQEALSLTVDELTLPIVQTLECLILYWYGTGKPRNGDICSGKSHMLRLTFQKC